MREVPKRIRDLQASAIDYSNRIERRRQGDCPHDSGRALGRDKIVNGTEAIYEMCPTCETRFGSAVRRDVLERRGIDIESIPIIADARALRPPCQRCGALGTDEHHFAPVAIFGREEADLWPKGWFCPDCHAWWHAMVAAYYTAQRTA